MLKNVRDDPEQGPVLVHVVTKKGHGYGPAEASADKYHGVGKFDVVTGAQKKSKPKAPNYTTTFARALIQEAEKDDKIVCVTAAMEIGTGMTPFIGKFPQRYVDVGIAEEPNEMFGKIMSISDELMWRYFDLLSFRSVPEINALRA